MIFAEQSLAYATDEAFEPSATYDRDGDCIEFLAKPDPFYAERIDDVASVYYSQETGEITGSLIKGVSRLMARHPGLCIEIRDGRVRLDLLLRASMWSSSDNVRVLQYQKLVEVAERSEIEAEGVCFA